MKLKIKFLATLALLTVTACANGRGDESLAFKPIRPTEADMVCMSDSLVDQIYAHDLTGQKLFKWKP